MKVMLLGGTGFIGRALISDLIGKGHQCVVLTRGIRKSSDSNVVFQQWNGLDLIPVYSQLDQCDAIVNLVGETIGKWPWTKQHKDRVISSRVNAGKAVSAYYQTDGKKPAVYIQSSGVGYYGDNPDQNLDESGLSGNDYLAEVAIKWEASTQALDSIAGVRRCIIRTSLVLDKRQGVLPLMALPAKLFIGGPLGNGAQGVSWIHYRDEVRAIVLLLEESSCTGVYNLSAPQPLSNKNFIQTIAKVLHRPFWFPVPSFLLKLVLGEMSDLLLKGQYAQPKRLLQAGFHFDYPTLESALIDIYRS